MTCEELTEQINTMRPQADTLLQDALNLRIQINIDYSLALAGDGYGGTYPPVPIQWGGLHTRVVYLGARMPPPNGLIASYNAVMTQLNTLGGIYDSLKITVDMLGDYMGQYTDQQCDPPL